MTILSLWSLCALLILGCYALPALLIDRCLAVGSWTRIGLTIFILLGPVGLALELLLLAAVCCDVVQQLRQRTGARRVAGFSLAASPRLPLHRRTGSII